MAMQTISRDSEAGMMMEEPTHPLSTTGPHPQPQPHSQPLEADEAPPDLPGWAWGPCLDRGGFGVIYAAVEQATHRSCVVKVVRSQHAQDHRLVARFRREALVTSILKHPHVVVYVTHGEWEGRPYLILERLHGASLERYVTETGPLSVEEVCRYACEALSALEYAHGQEIVHRDITPKNLFLQADGPLTLIDWGLASIAADRLLPNPQPLVTSSGAVFGTPLYMPPEQFTHFHNCDHRADLYSLGWSLIYGMTGLTPGGGLHDRQAPILCVRQSPIPLLAVRPELPLELVQILKQMVASDARHRFATLSAARAAFESLRSRLSPSSYTNVSYPLAKPQGDLTQGTTEPRLAAGLAGVGAGAGAVATTALGTDLVFGTGALEPEFQSVRDQVSHWLLEQPGPWAEGVQAGLSAVDCPDMRVVFAGAPGVGKSVIIQKLVWNVEQEPIRSRAAVVEYRYSTQRNYYLHAQGQKPQVVSGLDGLDGLWHGAVGRVVPERLEVQSPSDFLARGIVVYELPMGDSVAGRTDQEDLWLESDQVVVVLSPDLISPQYLKETFRRPLVRGAHLSPVWVVTRMDSLRRPAERQRMRDYAIKQINGFMSDDAQGVFFTGLGPEVESCGWGLGALHDRLLRNLGPGRSAIRRVRPLHLMAQAVAQAPASGRRDHLLSQIFALIPKYTSTIPMGHK